MNLSKSRALVLTGAILLTGMGFVATANVNFHRAAGQNPARMAGTQIVADGTAPAPTLPKKKPAAKA